MSRTIGIRFAAGELHAALVVQRARQPEVADALRIPLPHGRPPEEALREVAVRMSAERVRVAVAPGQGEVWLKLLSLPPLPEPDRVRMVEMEADRFFPVRGEPALVDLPTEGPAAGARLASVEALVARVEEVVGPVGTVQPAPRAVAAAWARLHPPLRGQVYAVVSQDGPWWELAIARGATLLGHARLHTPEPAALAEALLAAARPAGVQPRIIVAGEAVASPDVEAVVDALQSAFGPDRVEVREEIAPGVPAALAAAVGLALMPPGGLLPPAHRRQLQQAARRRTVAWAGAAVVAAMLLAGVGSWKQSQSAEQRSAEASRLAPRADSASRLLARAHQAQELARLTDSLTAARPDWVGVLAELAQRLPPGAYVTQLNGQGSTGTIEIRGYAGSATRIVPLLERSPRFSGVESMEAVTRRMVGEVELENFALRMKVDR